MQSHQKRKKARVEVYELVRSPFARGMTKRDLSRLLRTPLTTLEGLTKYKNSFVRRRTELSSGKARPLAYPEGPLRRINEKLAYQFRKIRLAPYVISPRRGLGQKDNAERHVGNVQFVKVDIKQFYPSITRDQIARFFRDECGMYVDVAGLLTELLTVDAKIGYGAPATPHLAAVMHRSMFDEIYAATTALGLTMTLWVDDLTISGRQVPGSLLEQIRQIVAAHGFQTHKIEFRHANRPVTITGIGVKRGNLVPPNVTNLRVRDLEAALRTTKNADEYELVANQLLSVLGSQRYIRNGNNAAFRKLSDRMHAIRQKKHARLRRANERPHSGST